MKYFKIIKNIHVFNIRNWLLKYPPPTHMNTCTNRDMYHVQGNVEKSDLF